ncbi:flagellar assembly peptidoglycan hydrolase FlgJ [Uliginosibacterium sp. H3]|uniref:Peptidoglycan hydrolase FlgJ n=1 Tax=Uliginosibacterium silvisoli TaxID=3114758 RepID=A0ABU6K6M5_9RHOO|nr:flagellar assembly peptidoglycan hydrolase FlgJ [Uliginosibacterium sp. H3]
MMDQINTLDVNALIALKRAAHENTPESIKATAKQFEALFLQMVLKSMRETVPKDGMLDSESTKFYEGLGDQQLAAVLAQRGGVGLAASIERQLLQQAGLPPADAKPVTGSSLKSLLPSGVMPAAPATPQVSPKVSAAINAPASDAQRFVENLWPQATEAARTLNVPAHFLVGQAALETGWGKSELRTADGRPTYNLFNIKAGKGWTGATVDSATTEYENGVAQTRVERFRAYGSYAEAFQDYARLVQQSPRYAAAQGQGDAAAFAKALQAGGYATDPAYADKLTKVINGNTLRQGLVASAR